MSRRNALYSEGELNNVTTRKDGWKDHSPNRRAELAEMTPDERIQYATDNIYFAKDALEFAPELEERLSPTVRIALDRAHALLEEARLALPEEDVHVD